MSFSEQLHGQQPARLLCPWDFLGKNAGVGCHFLLQGIFLTQGSNPLLLHLLHWQADSSLKHHLGIPWVSASRHQTPGPSALRSMVWHAEWPFRLSLPISRGSPTMGASGADGGCAPLILNLTTHSWTQPNSSPPLSHTHTHTPHTLTYTHTHTHTLTLLITP